MLRALLGLCLSLTFQLSNSAFADGQDPISPSDAQQIQSFIKQEFGDAVNIESLSSRTQFQILNGYQHLDPNHWVPADLLSQAVIYFSANKSRFRNQRYISVVDFRPRSDAYRFFLINLQTGEVERYHTSHGNGSVDGDPAFAVKFGNRGGSNMSSLGFARTGEVYVGSLKRSLRMDGLSNTNSNIRRRGVVIHGSDQVHEANVIQGVSGGCLMFDFAVRDVIIDKIRDGSLVFSGVSAL